MDAEAEAVKAALKSTASNLEDGIATNTCPDIIVPVVSQLKMPQYCCEEQYKSVLLDVKWVFPSMFHIVLCI